MALVTLYWHPPVYAGPGESTSPTVMVAPHGLLSMTNRLEREKFLLRNMLRAYREKPSSQQNRRIRDSLLRLIAPMGKKIIASTLPLNQEVDLRPFNLWLIHAGYEVSFPEIRQKGGVLYFRQWERNIKLYQGYYSTLFPKTRSKIPEIILVPLLGFDRRGYRIGYGGGYYDRTLVKYPNALPIGYGLSSQEREYIPHDSHDIPLPYIVTETEIIVTSVFNKTDF